MKCRYNLSFTLSCGFLKSKGLKTGQKNVKETVSCLLALTFIPLKIVKLTSGHFWAARTDSIVFFWLTAVQTRAFSPARKQTVRCNSFSWHSYEVLCQDAWSAAVEREICSHADNLWASIWSALGPCWWSKFLAAGGGGTVGCCPWEPLAFKLLTSCCIYVPFILWVFFFFYPREINM